MSGPSNDDLAGALVSTYTKVERTEAEVEVLREELRALREGGGERDQEGGQEGGHGEAGRVLTKDEYVKLSDPDKADMIDRIGVQGVRRLMAGQDVAVPKE